MKVSCANPECGKTAHTLSLKLGWPGIGRREGDLWFCSHKCYADYQADQCIEDKRSGLKKIVRRVKLGMLLVKNNFITKDQLSLALAEKSDTDKRLGEILIEAGHITEKELKAVLSMQAGVAPINLDPNTKVKLKENIPFKLINEFHFVIFDFDLESKIILIAVYDMDYLSSLEEFFTRVYPGYLIKYYLEDKEKIVAILTHNYPGKTFRAKAFDRIPIKEEILAIDKTVLKCMEFLSAFSTQEVKIDNLDNAVWIKGETRDFKIDVYLTKKSS